VRLLALAAAALAAAAAVAAARPDSGTGAMPAVVAVEVGGAPEVATGFARGTRVVTVAHVLAAGAALVVRDAGPARLARRARVVRVDRARDLAVLDVPGLRSAPAPPVGGLAVLVRRDGRVVALPVRVRRRIIARLGDATRAALELDAEVLPGDSGAPVVAPGDRLVGVVFARSEARASTAYAVDAAP
jgi:S1-C subfamily serine protease